KQQLNELENLCDGIFLLGELSPRIKDRVASYGELLSSYIIAATANAHQLSIKWVDSRKLIITNAQYGNAAVLFDKTNHAIQSYLKENNASVYLAPGFIAADEKG
ncbi:hypothetical protein, partial [Staphylococcus aureus]